MGEQGGVRLTRRGMRWRDMSYGIGLLCCGISLFALPSKSAAQYVNGPASVFGNPVPFFAGPGTEASPGAPGEPVPAWIFTPSLQLSETYTDNVNLAPKGQATSDLITSISPALGVIGNTPRLNLSFSYDPQLLLFALGTSSPVLQQQLQGSGKATLIPEILFFDGSASISQDYVSSAGPVAATTFTTNNNLQAVETANASPYFVHHFGSYADTESRYRFDVISVGGNTIAPQYASELTQTVKSGDYFGPLSWTLTGDYQRTNGLSGIPGVQGGSASKDAFAKVDAQYPVYERLSVTGDIGYERITNPTLTVQPVGVIWNIGLKYDPSPYAEASFTYGRRYGGSDIEFSGRYDIGPQTRISASYTQTIETTQSLIANNLNGAVIGPNGTLINPVTGLPIAPGNAPFGNGVTAFGLSNGSFLDKRFKLDLTATRGRNTYTATAFDERQSEQLSAGNTQAIGGQLNWSRLLWPDLTSNVSGSYSNISFLDGSGRVDNYYSASANLTYSVSRTVSTQLSVTRSDRESNQPLNSLIDDLITISIQKKF